MNSMRFILLITASPFTSQGSRTAYQFAKAVLEKHHTLTKIFFYSEGVFNACSKTNLPQDEPNLMNLWQRFAAESKLELNVCVTAAHRRGIMDKEEGGISTLAPGFTITGLGQLFEAAATADRFLVFN